MPSIPIQCPDSVLISLKETPEKFAKEATKVLAVKLYEMGKYGAPIFDLTKEELERDVKNA